MTPDGPTLQSTQSFQDRLSRIRPIEGVTGEEVVAQSRIAGAQVSRRSEAVSLNRRTTRAALAVPLSIVSGLIGGYLALVVVFLILPLFGADNTLTMSPSNSMGAFVEMLYFEAIVAMGLAMAFGIAMALLFGVTEFWHLAIAALASRVGAFTSVILVDFCTNTLMIAPPFWLASAAGLPF